MMIDKNNEKQVIADSELVRTISACLDSGVPSVELIKKSIDLIKLQYGKEEVLTGDGVKIIFGQRHLSHSQKMEIINELLIDYEVDNQGISSYLYSGLLIERLKKERQQDQVNN